MLLSYGGGEMNRHPTNGLRVLGPNLLICLQIQRPPPLIFPAPRCRILSLRSPWSSLSALSVISISEFSVVALYLSSPSSYSFVVKRFVKHLRSIKLFFNMDPLPENLVPRRIPNQCRPVVVVDGFEMDEQEKISRKILMAKTDHVHCGVPELPAHVLQSNPWQMEELSSNRIEHETVRDWLFTSDNARPGNIWQYYDDRKVAGNQLRRIQYSLANTVLNTSVFWIIFSEEPLAKQNAKRAITCVSNKEPKKVCHNDIDLLNPPAELDKRKHELKHLVQSPNSFSTVLQNDIDLLNPLAELETRKHKLKRLVQSPNYFFMDVKCQGCFNIDVVSHSQTVVVCGNCQTVLCQQIPGYKKKSKSVEMSKLLAVEELESTKTLIEDLKLNLDKAETEEKQAKRDSELAKRESELAKLGVEETQQGIFGEASVATKAQLEAAQARHTSAVSELESIKEELQTLQNEYDALVEEKELAMKEAEAVLASKELAMKEAEAVLASKEVERKVEEMPKLLQHH
ncbi:unnamed protein product [Brassica napus]|uniref:(rape) hypothetical protein n=1 Tax=Brassica napus TaxID=3708 RepID=A0A816QC34_BRANA|nr:unnamed protein product [Brassica napus]